MTDLAPVTTDLRCPGCGYDLRGLDATARCPECGRVCDREAAPSRIPWERRRRIGRVRAYLQTVWLALASPEVIAREAANGAVDRTAARAFRRTTVWIAWLPLAAAAVWLYLASLHSGGSLKIRAPDPAGGEAELFELRLPADVTNAWKGPAPLGWAFEFTVLATALAGVWLFLTAATAAQVYFFDVPRLPLARRASLSGVGDYAAAAVALAPFLFAALCGLVGLESYVTGRAPPWSIWSVAHSPAAVAFTVLTEVAVLLVFTVYWINLLVMLRVATGCRVRRLVAAVLGLPVYWAALAALVLVGLPAAVAFVGLIVLSLRG